MKGSTERSDKMRTRYIVDSYGWIEYFSNGKLADKYAKYIEKADQETYISPSFIIYEVYKRIRSKYNEEEALEAVVHIQAKTAVKDLDMRLSVKSADLALTENMHMADAIIYGTAMAMNAKIVTSDEHFKGRKNVIFIK